MTAYSIILGDGCRIRPGSLSPTLLPDTNPDFVVIVLEPCLDQAVQTIPDLSHGEGRSGVHV